jgi:ribokinase
MDAMNEQERVDSALGTVVVVGSANMDLVGAAPRLPSPGETVLGTTFSQHPGGKGANQAVAAARAGSPTTFIGCIGDDTFGDALLHSLRDSGASVDHLRRINGVNTGIALIVVDDDGHNQITVLPGANAEVGDQELDALSRLLSPQAVVVIQLEIPMPIVARIVQIAHASGARLLLNPAPAAPLDDTLLRSVDIIVPNEFEVRTLLGRTDGGATEDAALALAAHGPETVIVTLGEDGVLVVHNGATHRVPAHHVRARDTTAAGDAFVGALAASLAQGDDITRAVAFANAAAALSVQTRGAQPSMPLRADIDAMLADDGPPLPEPQTRE